ncbi:JAB domain-containing protein [Ralstonia pseudosolanacearum]|uniref:JAB domain-containing protein n=1 Tax=Ralstonia pseudosolanacearum TaxID=1310165 RepID=UPI00399D5B65
MSPTHLGRVVVEALEHNAAAVILSHNRPTGGPEPRRADQALTPQFRSALSVPKRYQRARTRAGRWTFL